MNELKLICKNHVVYADSRNVAELVGKRHTDLLRDIDRYIEVLSQNAILRFDDFFVETSYTTGTGKNYKAYFLTKKGCDMVANKMTGDKGILFTATYIDQFYEMEAELKEKALPADTHKEERLALMKRRVIVSEANAWEKLAYTQDKAFNDYCRKNAALVLRGKKTKPYVAGLDSEEKQPVPAPQIAQRQTKFMYSVADIAEMFDVAVKTIAEAAIKNNMVTPKYGCWVDNVAPYSRRRVKAFRYYASSVETFKEILKAGGNHVAG